MSSKSYFQKTYPLCFVLLKNKQLCTYKMVFERLKKIIQNKFQRSLKIDVVHTDFERALYEAIKSCFHCKIKLCWFHYTQNIIRNLKEKKLFKFYQKNKIFNDLVQTLMLLPFLPKDQMMFLFFALKRNWRIVSTTMELDLTNIGDWTSKIELLNKIDIFLMYYQKYYVTSKEMCEQVCLLVIPYFLLSIL